MGRSADDRESGAVAPASARREVYGLSPALGAAAGLLAGWFAAGATGVLAHPALPRIDMGMPGRGGGCRLAEGVQWAGPPSRLGRKPRPGCPHDRLKPACRAGASRCAGLACSQGCKQNAAVAGRRGRHRVGRLSPGMHVDPHGVVGGRSCGRTDRTSDGRPHRPGIMDRGHVRWHRFPRADGLSGHRCPVPHQGGRTAVPVALDPGWFGGRAARPHVASLGRLVLRMASGTSARGRAV